MKELHTIKRTEKGFEASEYVHIPIRIKFHLKYSYLLVVILIGSLISFFSFQNTISQTNPNQTVPFSSVSSVYTPFSNDGFLFPKSSTQYLTNSDIRNLKSIADEYGYEYSELLRYAVNEIYARHGYQFISGRKFEHFYSQYQWYLDLEKKTTIQWSEFNDVEQANLSLLLNEEEKNGYR